MTTNGETTGYSSAFISHLDTFPVIHDGVAYFKGHPVGQKSISVSQSAYDTLVRPFSPYLAKATPYAKPYVSKADQLADSSLGKLESRLPIVKEPTEKLKERITSSPVFNTASGVLSYGNEKKDYAFKVYSDEYSKAGDGKHGIVYAAKASINTSIILTAQTVSWFASFLTAKKEEAKEVVQEKTSE